jgi:hypothetical protein
VAGTTPALAEQDKSEITVPYDVFGKTSTMRKDWSFSAFIEYSDKRILFDMGKTKGIDRSLAPPHHRSTRPS